VQSTCSALNTWLLYVAYLPQGDAMSHDVFTSYSRNDQDRMKHIREALENSGLEVWTDTGIKPNTVKLSEI
jgi:hypothetical protein